jgi:putative glycosyltransferase (TIGR04372 family)
MMTERMHNWMNTQKAHQGLRRYLVDRQLQSIDRDEQHRRNRKRRRRIKTVARFLIPLILVVRLLRPVLHIRFGHVLRHKIGHCPLEAELYLLERAGGVQPKGTLDLFHFDHGTDGQAANLFAEALVKRNLHIYWWVEILSAANRMVPGGSAHQISIDSRGTDSFKPGANKAQCDALGDRYALMQSLPVQIQFRESEELLGRELLRQMGVPKDAPFVCVHVRDSSYWLQRKPSIGSESDYRNSDLRTYFPAMKAIAERGYYVLRIGARVSEPLPEIHPRVIDYTTTSRTEFMDVFLAARCTLMLSTASGIDSITYCHRRAILFANLASWDFVFPNYVQECRMLPKLFRRNSDMKILSMKEIYALNPDRLEPSTEFFRENDITLVDNSSEEIRDAAMEMLDVLEGKHEETEEAQELQARMRQRLTKDRDFMVSPVKVAESFLLGHKEIFD